jgi:hypothetical protein
LEFIVPWLVVGVLLYAMRRLERWQHQHIFKVGWLLTKNLQTTTIFYYTFFLPGVFMHEFVYWMAAGILNVRAERAIAWPEAQAIAELNLNFIKLARNTSRIKVAIISIVPLLSGLALIWLITNNILNLTLILAVLRGGKLEDFGSALTLLLSTPDVWIWVYLVFAIANTMFPNMEALRGWRPVLIGAGVVIALLFLFGVAQQMFLDNLAQPITDGLSRLALIITVVIAIDLLVTGVLGTIEALIERVTKDSATFQNGKLVAITREEMLARRQKEQQRAKEERERQRNPVKTRAPAGPPSIYKLALPIPGAPGKDLSEPIIVSRDEKSVLSSGVPPVTPPLTRSNPQIITGAATVIKNDDELKPEKPLPEAHIDLPSFAVKREPPKLAAALSDEDEEEVADETEDESIDDEDEEVDQSEDDESEDEEEEERL